MLKILGALVDKFSRPGDLVSGICTPLFWAYISITSCSSEVVLSLELQKYAKYLTRSGIHYELGMLRNEDLCPLHR